MFETDLPHVLQSWRLLVVSDCSQPIEVSDVPFRSSAHPGVFAKDVFKIRGGVVTKGGRVGVRRDSKRQGVRQVRREREQECASVEKRGEDEREKVRWQMRARERQIAAAVEKAEGTMKTEAIAAKIAGGDVDEKKKLRREGFKDGDTVRADGGESDAEK